MSVASGEWLSFGFRSGPFTIRRGRTRTRSRPPQRPRHVQCSRRLRLGRRAKASGARQFLCFVWDPRARRRVPKLGLLARDEVACPALPSLIYREPKHDGLSLLQHLETSNPILSPKQPRGRVLGHGPFVGRKCHVHGISVVCCPHEFANVLPPQAARDIG